MSYTGCRWGRQEPGLQRAAPGNEPRPQGACTVRSQSGRSKHGIPKVQKHHVKENNKLEFRKFMQENWMKNWQILLKNSLKNCGKLKGKLMKNRRKEILLQEHKPASKCRTTPRALTKIAGTTKMKKLKLRPTNWHTAPRGCSKLDHEQHDENWDVNGTSKTGREQHVKNSERCEEQENRLETNTNWKNGEEMNDGKLEESMKENWMRQIETDKWNTSTNGTTMKVKTMTIKRETNANHYCNFTQEYNTIR